MIIAGFICSMVLTLLIGLSAIMTPVQDDKQVIALALILALSTVATIGLYTAIFFI